MIGEVAQRLGRTDDVTVITWNDVADPPLDGVMQVHSPVRAFHLPPPMHPFGQLLRSWIGSVRAARVANREAFDVAYVSACQWVQAPEGLRRLSIPTLYFAHEGRRRSIEQGYITHDVRGAVAGRVRRLGTWLFELIASWMDGRAMGGSFRLVTNSEHGARRLEMAYARRAAVVTLGVDGERFRPDARIPRGDALVSVGAIEPMKNQLLAVEALGRIERDLRPQLRLIANRVNDDYLRLIQDAAAELSVDVALLIGVDDAVLVDEYRSARALVATAINEPFGLTVPEASAVGTPTIAVRSGGFVETVVDGVNGILVEPTADDLADAIRRLRVGGIPLSDDVPAWARARWSWDRCAAEIRHICVQLVASST
jgi:glycosyltransferase involved in cell wall biosynthesis